MSKTGIHHMDASSKYRQQVFLMLKWWKGFFSFSFCVQMTARSRSLLMTANVHLLRCLQFALAAIELWCTFIGYAKAVQNPFYMTHVLPPVHQYQCPHNSAKARSPPLYHHVHKGFCLKGTWGVRSENCGLVTWPQCLYYQVSVLTICTHTCSGQFKSIR